MRPIDRALIHFREGRSLKLRAIGFGLKLEACISFDELFVSVLNDSRSRLGLSETFAQSQLIFIL